MHKDGYGRTAVHSNEQGNQAVQKEVPIPILMLDDPKKEDADGDFTEAGAHDGPRLCKCAELS